MKRGIRSKHLSILFFLIVMLVPLVIAGTFSGSSKISATGNPSYIGAAECRTCHEEEYVGWNQTDHAHMAGIAEINASGTFYWVAYETNVMDEASFLARCARCHVTGWDAATQSWPEKDTDPEKFLNVQCEVCHGPGEESMIINYSSTVCATCHAQPADLEISAHNDSLTNLLASPHAADYCLKCHSTQAFLGENVYLNSTGLEPIACATCHNPHSAKYEYQLRYENSTELCGQCHEGFYNPQYEFFTTGPHEKAGLECVSCHGQGTRLFHDVESPWFNHTFWIYYTFYPYNQTEPMVCTLCHTKDWATSQLGVIQDLTVELVTNVTQAIEDAESAITAANQTSGVDVAKVNEAADVVEKAEYYVNYVEHEGSKGFHNPEGSYARLSMALLLAREAESIALTARAETLAGTVSDLQGQITTLQGNITTLQGDIENLEKRIDDLEAISATAPYLYGGIGIAIGFAIGAIILYVVRRK